MESVELGANIFRITQTEALLEKQKEFDEKTATNTHYKVGKIVRKAIYLMLFIPKKKLQENFLLKTDTL